MRLFLLFRSPLILWSLSCILVISAYWPSLAGPLVFDDQLNIVENPGVAIHDLSFESLKRAALSNDSGHLKRVLPALSFGINHYFANGFSDTFVFKLTNLVIHLVNSALVFWLCYLLWPRSKLWLRGGVDAGASAASPSVLPAAFAALAWALHPLQVNAVVYIVQRMATMSATFVLLGLTIFVLGRQRLADQRSYGIPLMTAGIIGGSVLGLLCKENAALLNLYAGVIEFTLFSRNTLESAQKRRLEYFYVIVLGVPLCAGFIYMFIYPGGILNGYLSRPFTLTERLLTEARVLWFYLYLLCIPDIIAMGLFHDDIAVSSGWLTPWTTLPSVMAWILIVPLAWLLRKKSPIFAFAVLWFLAGHSMESTFIPLELVFEHRNYVPSLGPLLLLCALSSEAATLIQTHRDEFPAFSKHILWIKPTLALIIVAGLYRSTLMQAEYWRTEDGFIASQAVNHPFSPSCQYLYGEVLYKKEHNPLEAYPFYFRAAQLKPEEVGFLISLQMVTPVAAQKDLQNRHLPELLNPRYIERLIRERPVSAWGMRALDVAGRCVVAKYAVCQEHINDIRLWLQAFARNPLAGKDTQRHFTNVLFDIEMAYALYDDALNSIQTARAKDPGFVRYTLMHADVLAAKKRYQEALQLLTNAQQQWREDTNALNSITRLRSAIATLASRSPRS